MAKILSEASDFDEMQLWGLGFRVAILEPFLAAFPGCHTKQAF